MKKFFHSISTMMLLVALTGMGLASCSESPEAPEDPTENPDDEDKGDGSEGEGGDENKTVELNYTVAEAAYWGDDYMEDGTSNLIVYLYDSPRDEDGVHTGPKDHFNIDMNLPNFNGGELLIPARSYPIGEPEVYAPNTLEPGFADEFEIGGVLYGDYYGVFHQVIDAEQNETYEMVSEGEMTVGYENGVYTIDATFTTEEGVVYHVTYKGAITVDDESLGEPDDEDWYSTLTDDVEVDALTQGQLYYMGADDKSSLFGILLGTEGVTLSNGRTDAVFRQCRPRCRQGTSRRQIRDRPAQRPDGARNGNRRLQGGESARRIVVFRTRKELDGQSRPRLRGNGNDRAHREYARLYGRFRVLRRQSRRRIHRIGVLLRQNGVHLRRRDASSQRRTGDRSAAAGRQACGTYTPIDGVFRKLRQSSDVLSASGTTNEEGPVMSTGPSC